MSANEAFEEVGEDHDYDEYDRNRKRKWEEAKKASVKSRRASMSVIFVIIFVLFTLLIDIAPVADSVRQGVLQSWQFRLVCALLFLLVLYRVWFGSSSLESVSFVELDERNRFEKARYSSAIYNNAIQKYLETLSVDDAGLSVNEDIATKVERSRKAVLGYDFVEHMRSIVESLDHQIDYAEEKASILLEAGRNFVRGGIWLYVVNIIIWQAYLFYIDFALSPGVVLGMVSSTMIFLIMEFLGAWYLKQYRHYGDSAFSYMKVRSSYNKYMLAYCVVVEFTTDDYSEAKQEMLAVLGESEKWPELKDVNSNDFNYMLQSVDSMGAVFEKLKGVFGRHNSTGGSA